MHAFSFSPDIDSVDAVSAKKPARHGQQFEAWVDGDTGASFEMNAGRRLR
jgi:hypothetical protein